MLFSLAAVILQALLAGLFFADRSVCSILKRSQDQYDFIIVGGGTAGLALAARLTEDGTQSVLVLEAGQTPRTVSPYVVPGLNLEIAGSVIDWDFVTPPQSTTANRTLPYQRGRCLGGSSSTNGLAYFRGSASIFDNWQGLGNPGWSWNDVFPLFKKSTTFSSNKNGSYATYDSAAYGNGPLQVAFAGYSPAPTLGFIEACSNNNIPIVGELNNGSSIGIKLGTASIDKSNQRSSSYDSYFIQSQNRTNLNVMIQSPVQQLIINRTASELTAQGVVYKDQLTGDLLNATARKEVIMSAGAFQTPQLMMLSGIGPQDVLEQNGIDIYLDNSNVGANLQDNPTFGVIARTQSQASTSEVYNNYGNLYNEQTEWFSSRQGRLTGPTGVTNGFQQLSTTEITQLGGQSLITLNRTDQAHIQYGYVNVFYPTFPTPEYAPLLSESYVSIMPVIMAATSRGNVSIQSSNPSDSPVINLNYFETDFDKNTAILAFKTARSIFADPALSQYTIGPNNGEVAPGLSVQSDEEIIEYVLKTTIPNWHASGTCAMLPQGQGGVVDPRLRVYGIQGLRIVDASIFPVIPDANIQAAVYMVAEKAALMIAEDYGFTVA